MKRILARAAVGLASTMVLTTSSAALVYTYSGPSVAVPDNNALGRAFGFSIMDTANEITDVSVNLDISGGFNGDLYAYLSHDSGFAVLLNRTGVGETTPGSSATGYLDTGFALTLSSAASANIHFYQNHSPAYNGSGQLTGFWQPDGRNVDPDSAPGALDASGTADFGSFTGLNPNGDWTLFIADRSAGGISTIDGFTVDITAVPEPVHTALGIFAILVAGTSALRRWRSRFTPRRVKEQLRLPQRAADCVSVYGTVLCLTANSMRRFKQKGVYADSKSSRSRPGPARCPRNNARRRGAGPYCLLRSGHRDAHGPQRALGLLHHQ